jgi:hypothetical protein
VNAEAKHIAIQIIQPKGTHVEDHSLVG